MTIAALLKQPEWNQNKSACVALFKKQHYKSSFEMASLMLSINPSCSGRYELLKMSANSLYHLKQYRRAMRYFEDCLSSLLALSQGNGKSSFQRNG
jgi:hypothetical protein